MRSDHHLPSHRRSTGPETGWQFPPHQVSPHLPLNPQRQNFSRVHKVPSKHRTQNDLVIAKKTFKSLQSIGGSPTPAHPRRQVHKAQICRSIIHIDLTLNTALTVLPRAARPPKQLKLFSILFQSGSFTARSSRHSEFCPQLLRYNLHRSAAPRSKWLRPAPPHTPRSTQKTLHLVVF